MYAWAPTTGPGASCWSARKNLWIISRNKDHRFLETPVNISGSLPLSVGQGGWCLERKGLLRPLIRARSATLDSQSRTLLTASRGNGTQVFTLEWGTEPENNILHRILVALSSSDIYFVNKSRPTLFCTDDFWFCDAHGDVSLGCSRIWVRVPAYLETVTTNSQQ